MNKYKLELTETQLQIINDALEEYFRIPLNQWSGLADRLAFKEISTENNKDKDEMFDRCVVKRDAAMAVFEAAGKILWGYSIPRKDKTQLVAEDIWQAIRHQLYLDSGITNTWRVDSRIPIQWGSEPMPKIEKIKKEADSK